MIEPLVETVVVTTYARPDSLGLLLDDLEREAPPGGLDVRVYDDATPNPDPGIEQRVRARGWVYHRAAAHHDKHGWWRWWNTILADLRRVPAPLYYVLQDDMRLCERFFARTAAAWHTIDDPRKASLYLHLSIERSALGDRCWTPVRAMQAGDLVQCGWVDCGAFVCDRRLFDALGWRLHPVSARRWHEQELMSSGVGEQLSVRAHQAGLRMYRVARSYTVHDGSPSLMSAEARKRWPMETVAFVDGDAAARARTRVRPEVFASLASVPVRERGLQQVVAALLPQVDFLGVFLNDYPRVPRFLEDERIVVAQSQEHGVRGDAGKFFWAGTTRGYHLVGDDDLRYPSDYVERLVAGIERHGRRAVVGFHGGVLHDQVDDYYASRRLLHFSQPLAADTPVHVLGTGVAGYHVSAIGLRAADFETPNMADIWLALVGQRRAVPFVCLRRSAGWLTELPGLHAGSIYVRDRARNGAESHATRAVRANGAWQLHAPARDVVSDARRVARPTRLQPPRRPPSRRPLVRVRVSGPEHSATLVLPDRDHITEAIRQSGTYYERDLLDAIRARARRGVFVDVGAHFGNHTTFFGLECGADVVVAVEPNPHAFAGLLETVAENGLENVVVAHRVAAHPSWRSVAVTTLPWRPRDGTRVRSNSGRVGVAPVAGGGTPAAPLDEILASVERVDVVKVDAEGLGSDILFSARRVLRRDRPLVAAEAASAGERRALRAILSPLGYREVGRYCWTPTWLWEPAPEEIRSPELGS
jgi:FkbM family methyltransferase